MKRRIIIFSVLTLLLAAPLLIGYGKFHSVVKIVNSTGTTHQSSQSVDWKPVEKVFNRKGTAQNDMFKVTFPRSDLKVKLDNVTIEPGLALTSWVAFKTVANQTMFMGDLVLLEKEVGPVMSQLAICGIDITALHNHLINESPKVMYMHIRGQGDSVALAEKIKDALALTNTPMATAVTQSSTSSSNELTQMESIFGTKGSQKGNVIQFSIPRREPITEMGMEIPPFMGTAHAINFQLIGKKAATTGDLVLVASEVNPVIRSLTQQGIKVTAVHNHMLTASPRLFYLHFWGVDDPVKLARSLKNALDQTQ